MISKDTFRIMVVDDEKSFLLLIVSILKDAGYEVKGFTSPAEALQAITEFRPELIITDMKMPGMDGMELMRKAIQQKTGAEFIMITAFATVDAAVDAMKQGAADYITKPLRDPGQLRTAVSRIQAKKRPAETSPLKTTVTRRLPPVNIIFAGIEKTYQAVTDVAPANATVILYGETGTGKSLIAKVIHQLSQRSGPFIEINCAAIPENLLESELFGYERGAFTGASAQKKGRFELARDGTIFLDEISEMSMTLQAKLLRVLQERSFERLGSVSTIQTNARIIAATNRDLKSFVEEKKFREDLYYRLSVFPITIPPLRSRSGHIPLIAEHLLTTMSAEHGREALCFDEDDFMTLTGYGWPGNIRELENVIERSIIVCKGSRLELPALETAGDDTAEDKEDMKSIERRAIEASLEKAEGNRKRAAEMLGISLRSLQYKIKDYNIAARKG
ncbi:MAG: sigma-54-dependent Fis family transcriptional regulator [Thermodesulfovibrio sp.]|nr:sigma-54-dependent Fis family transcriptional regulator [Thermodesulfovibrio sp.]